MSPILQEVYTSDFKGFVSHSAKCFGKCHNKKRLWTMQSRRDTLWWKSPSKEKNQAQKDQARLKKTKREKKKLCFSLPRQPTLEHSCYPLRSSGFSWICMNTKVRCQLCDQLLPNSKDAQRNHERDYHIDSVYVGESRKLINTICLFSHFLYRPHSYSQN